ncbi:UNVERIFIED_CONTAM: hypothetical protein FKN15_056034 [Acipenser sinensis]
MLGTALLQRVRQPMARAMVCATEINVEKNHRELKMKFSADCMIAVEELPFTKFNSQVVLIKKNGLDVSKTYDNDTACAEFVAVIAEEIRDLQKGVHSANYISVLTDCGTDGARRDYVIVYCSCVSAGVVVNHLVGLAELDHCHVQGILNTTKNLLGKVDKEYSDWWRDKLSAFGADGASVNMGATEEVGALLRSEMKRQHILSFHCLPHRLELAMLSAQRSVPMIEKVYDLLQLVWQTYHFSPKSKHQLKAIGAELGCTIRAPSAVKRQRWLPHIYPALSVFCSQMMRILLLDRDSFYCCASPRGASCFQF